MFPYHGSELYRNGIAYLCVPAILRTGEYVIIWKGLNSCSLPWSKTAGFPRVNIHITIKFHVRCNRLTYLIFVQLEIFILKYMVSVFIRHYIRNRRV